MHLMYSLYWQRQSIFEASKFDENNCGLGIINNFDHVVFGILTTRERISNRYFSMNLLIIFSVKRILDVDVFVDVSVG